MNDDLFTFALPFSLDFWCRVLLLRLSDHRLNMKIRGHVHHSSWIRCTTMLHHIMSIFIWRSRSRCLLKWIVGSLSYHIIWLKLHVVLILLGVDNSLAQRWCLSVIESITLVELTLIVGLLRWGYRRSLELMCFWCNASRDYIVTVCLNTLLRWGDNTWKTFKSFTEQRLVLLLIVLQNLKGRVLVQLIFRFDSLMSVVALPLILKLGNILLFNEWQICFIDSDARLL
jgi:hypothetical protein